MDCDVLVIGGGIVGLSTAHALSRLAPGTRVVVLEERGAAPVRPRGGRRDGRQDGAVDSGGSDSGTVDGDTVDSGGVDSGVVDSGIHHRPGSLTARFAVRGAVEMAAFCAEHGVPHEVTGKLVVATERAELPRLHALVQRGRRLGVPVRELGPAQIREYEPEVRALAAIRVGTTAVVDHGRLAAQLARSSGAEIRYGARAEGIRRRPGRVAVRTASGEVLRAKVLVNCAGVRSDRVARLAGDDPGVRISAFRGEYYDLARPSLLRGPIDALPDPARPFPGVHLLRGIDGEVHVAAGAAGPRRAAGAGHGSGAGAVPVKREFVEAVRRVLPGVSEADLVPAAGPAGLRARAVRPDGTPVDEVLVRETPGAVHVVDVALPGVAGALPVGSAVARRALRMLRD
ncbi:FAD-dependent oxidoreductase [Streptomyces sp. NPDC059917]|uniref:FAD-dependent oxidoreductase n=1 Tax=Streptomyces sp. NPDC059917 TaxID=3347002 RepID=UPI00365FD8CF